MALSTKLLSLAGFTCLLSNAHAVTILRNVGVSNDVNNAVTFEFTTGTDGSTTFWDLNTMTFVLGGSGPRTLTISNSLGLVASQSTTSTGTVDFDFTADNVVLDASETYTASLSGNFNTVYQQGSSSLVVSNGDGNATIAAVTNILPEVTIDADPSAVPEPSGALLLSLGVMVAFTRRRR